jgi:leader peptidase (prepilin peptidase) / N-methyltransferase
LIGSFIGLLSVRLPADQPVLLGRSRCQSCGVTLPPWRLVPVVSYAISAGRCSGCSARIPARYPLIELACAGIGLWAALSGRDPVHAVLTALLGWQLLLIAIIDAEHFWLPDRLTLPLLVSGLAASAWLASGVPIDALVGAIVGFAGLWLVAFAYRRLRGRQGLGGGDPIFLGAIGAWVGWIGLPSVLLWASAAGLSVVAAKAVTGRVVSGQDRLPFGVFLAVGAWLTWQFGPLGLGV